jgi:hypothetical protein
VGRSHGTGGDLVESHDKSEQVDLRIHVNIALLVIGLGVDPLHQVGHRVRVPVGHEVGDLPAA